VRLFLLPLFAAAAIGQIAELATTDDGSQLYFSTAYRLKGSGQYTNPKIFQLANGSYSLVAQTDPNGAGAAQQLELHLPVASGDGSIVTWEQIACPARKICGIYDDVSKTEPSVSGIELPAEMTSSGSLRVSPNGRFFLQYCCGFSSGANGSSIVYDSALGTLTTIPGFAPVSFGRQAIADDGTALLTRWPSGNVPLALFLWNNGTLIQIPTQSLQYSFDDPPRLSADAQTMVYRSSDGAGAVKLIAHRLDSGDENVLATGPPAVGFSGPGGFCSCPLFLGQYFRHSISNDGQRVLFLARDSANHNVSEVFVINSDGTGLRQLTFESSGINEAVLSGDGHTAFAAAVNNDLLAINVDTGDIQRLLSDLPSFSVNALVPGSRAYVQGQRLMSPDGRNLVSIAEFDAPVVSASANQVALQIPWEVPIKQNVMLVASAASSPFELAIVNQTVVAAPSYFQALHADFRGPLTQSDPGHPGEVIVVQATGFGPVSPAVATGQNAPDDPLSFVQLPISCTWQNPNLDVPVFFAGLAPQFVGLYQINVMLPFGIEVGGGYLTCSLANAFSGMSGWIEVAPQ
jgi:uncharacterized protein (TIGR03437 family)